VGISAEAHRAWTSSRVRACALRDSASVQR
jgi:hypothetical protein